MNRPNQEIHLKLLRHLEHHPDVTQRELAQHLGVSLGKANYCLKALIDRGWIKANNFKNSKNKAAYAYLLTPRGVEKKAQITLRFFKKKVVEYEQLKQELVDLELEVAKQNSSHIAE
jgi:EPS-associated MarR family transcriptional regulator